MQVRLGGGSGDAGRSMRDKEDKCRAQGREQQ